MSIKKTVLYIALFFLCFTARAAAKNIETGDYIYLGKCDGQKILWRCADIDENGALMVAEHILSLKSFDAKRSGECKARNEYGSNFWEQSCIRAWLNSEDSSVTWGEGAVPADSAVMFGKNGYEDEAGFLSSENFTVEELSVIATVGQKNVLSQLDTDGRAEGGTELHCIGTIGNIKANYDSAYYHTVSDRMFLLSSQQLSRMLENLGEDSFYATPARACAEDNRGTFGEISTEGAWSWWLREPLSADAGSRVVYALASSDGRNVLGGIKSRGWLAAEHAYNDGIGIRPAFYLKLENAAVQSGEGNKRLPYTVGVQPTLTAYGSAAMQQAGGSIFIYCETKNLAASAILRLVSGKGEKKAFANGDRVYVAKGINCFYVAAFSPEGEEICRSEKIYILGGDYAENTARKISADDWESDTDFIVTKGRLTPLRDAEENLYLSAASEVEVYMPVDGAVSGGRMHYEYAVYVNSDYQPTLNGEIFPLYINNAEWSAPFSFKNGYIYFDSRRISERLEALRWYTVSVSYNIANRTASISVDGSLLADEIRFYDGAIEYVTNVKFNFSHLYGELYIKNLSGKIEDEQLFVDAPVAAYPAEVMRMNFDDATAEAIMQGGSPFPDSLYVSGGAEADRKLIITGQSGVEIVTQPLREVCGDLLIYAECTLSDVEGMVIPLMGIKSGGEVISSLTVDKNGRFNITGVKGGGIALQKKAENNRKYTVAAVFGNKDKTVSIMIDGETLLYRCKLEDETALFENAAIFGGSTRLELDNVNIRWLDEFEQCGELNTETHSTIVSVSARALAGGGNVQAVAAIYKDNKLLNIKIKNAELGRCEPCDTFSILFPGVEYSEELQYKCFLFYSMNTLEPVTRIK